MYLSGRRIRELLNMFMLTTVRNCKTFRQLEQHTSLECFIVPAGFLYFALFHIFLVPPFCFASRFVFVPPAAVLFFFMLCCSFLTWAKMLYSAAMCFYGCCNVLFFLFVWAVLSLIVDISAPCAAHDFFIVHSDNQCLCMACLENCGRSKITWFHPAEYCASWWLLCCSCAHIVLIIFDLCESPQRVGREERDGNAHHLVNAAQLTPPWLNNLFP